MVPSALATMRFQVPERYKGMRAGDIRRYWWRTSARSRQLPPDRRPTDINGVSDKPSVFPALFLSVGLTIPERERTSSSGSSSASSKTWHGTTSSVWFSSDAWEGTGLADLPRLQEMIERCGSVSRAFGFFRVIELADQEWVPTLFRSCGIGARGRARA